MSIVRATSQKRLPNPDLNMSMLGTPAYSLYGESYRGQVVSHVSPATLRPSTGFGKANAWQCLEDSDVVDSILLRGAASAPLPNGAHAAAPVPRRGGTGSRDVLGANLVRGIRSTLAPVPFTPRRAAQVEPFSYDPSAWESFLLDCEKDPSTMNRTIDLDSLCATFNSDRDETVPSESSPSTSAATVPREQDLGEPCCEVCGGKDENRILCSGSCCSAAAVCMTCWREDVASRNSAAFLHRRETAWLCTRCQESVPKDKQQAIQRQTQTESMQKRKRTCQGEDGHQERARALKQRVVKYSSLNQT